MGLRSISASYSVSECTCSAAEHVLHSKPCAQQESMQLGMGCTFQSTIRQCLQVLLNSNAGAHCRSRVVGQRLEVGAHAEQRPHPRLRGQHPRRRPLRRRQGVKVVTSMRSYPSDGSSQSL